MLSRRRKALDFLWMYKPDMSNNIKTNKIKPLAPSLRESNRNIAFEVVSEKQIKSSESIKSAVTREFRLLFGDVSLAKSNLLFVGNTWNPSSQRGIIKVERKYIDHVKAALMFVNNIDNEEVMLRSLLSSGMINRVKKITIGG